MLPARGRRYKLVNMKSLIISLFLLLNLKICHSQDLWERITSTQTFLTEDIAMDSKGKVYIAVKGHNDIFEINIVQNEIKYVRLPDVWQPYFALIHSKKIWINGDDSLVNYFIYGGVPLPYYLKNNSFYPAIDYSDTSLHPFVTTTEKFDRSGEYYFSALNEIYKYKTLWEFNGIERVFSLSNGENLIADYFPFTSENNYAVVSNIDNTFSIYNYSTKTKKSERIINTNLNIESSKVVITEDGNIFLPTTNGLYHYSDNGNSVDVPVIDADEGPYTHITDLRQSKRGDAVIARTNGKFYFSYDTGKTWIKPINFNINFPSDHIVKMEIWDSLHAVAFLKYGCFEEQSLLLTNNRVGWTAVNPGINYYELTKIFKTVSGRLFGLENNCDYIYSDNDGINWRSLKVQNNAIRNLLKVRNENLLAWNPGDSILNFSDDFGDTWDNKIIFEGEIQNVTNLFDLNVFLVSITDSRGSSPKFHYYLSVDGGKSWVKQNSNSFPKINTKGIVWDNGGSIISYGSNSTNVYMSSDFGKSWKVDNRFLNMKIFDLIFTEDNSVLVNGVIDNIRGVFLSRDYKLFELLTGASDGIKYLKNGLIVAYSVVDGIRISNDFGKSWESLSRNLPLNEKVRTTIYNDFYLNGDGIAYLSLGYDGLYKTKDALVGIKKIAKDELIVNLSPNPVESLLNIEMGDEFKDLNVLCILKNLMGQTVLRYNMNFQNSILNISEIPKGVYFLEFQYMGKLICSNRVVKI